MDDLRKPTFWISQVIWLVGIVAAITWTAARYPNRGDVEEMVAEAPFPSRAEVETMISTALAGPLNPYVKDEPAIRRVVTRYDNDMEAMARRLDEMTSKLQDLVIEVRVLTQRRPR